ncbi:MAG: class II fructose-bisphosphate aldolase, partial [Holdemania filiformis]
MLVSMKDILQHAHKHNYAVMAVNSINMEMARAVISAAEEEHSPIIVQMGPGQIGKHAHLTEIVPLVKELAERASIPVALNLDHGGKLEDMVTAIHNGFTSLMIDASSYPYEENVKRTSVVCALAHPHGICVEAELGHVGQAADGDNSKVDLYTNVEKAKKFVEDTGCDALAVAIGTAHGDYPKGYVPELNFERLAELKKALDMPLVLHGGSGSGEENIRKAVAGGINKINVCTDAFHAAKNAMLENLEVKPNADYLELCMT